MAITYNAGTNVIMVTGYTVAVPCNFTDIYNADVAGGWGVVTRQCTNQFCFDCGLQIGDASTTTWFADVLKHVIFKVHTTTGVYAYGAAIFVTANASFRLGAIINATNKTSRNGCCVLFDFSSTGEALTARDSGKIHLYSTSLLDNGTQTTFHWHRYGTTGHKFESYNCIISSDILASDGSEVDFYNVNINSSGLAGTIGLRAKGSIDRINISGTTMGALGFRFAFGSVMKNVYARNNTYLARVREISVDGYMVNMDADAYTFSYFGTNTANVHRQYELDLKVIDKDNSPINAATVKIWDKDSSLIVDTTTNASGVIATQTITRGYYNQANGNTLQEASPHLIKIEKAGYTMYEADFTLEDKTDWLIALQTSILRNPSMGGGMV